MASRGRDKEVDLHFCSSGGHDLLPYTSAYSVYSRRRQALFAEAGQGDGGFAGNPSRQVAKPPQSNSFKLSFAGSVSPSHFCL